MLTGFSRDLVHAARALSKARAFTLVCVLSLGIGMAPVIAVPLGAQLLSMPPPGVNTGTLVELDTTRNGPRERSNSWSYPDFVDLRDAQTGATLIGWATGDSSTTIETPAGKETDAIYTLFVSANYFPTVGVTLAQGPGFTRAAAEPEVILGQSFWKRRLVSDPAIVGKMLTLDGVPHRVVGVAPDQFEGHLGFQGGQLFVPLERHPHLRADNGADINVRADRADAWVHIHGRLAPGVSVAQASGAVGAVTAQLARQYPKTNEFTTGVANAYHAMGALQGSQALLIQTAGFVMTGIVLLVVCLNISGMMQVRGAIRERELSIRQAIGASRGRLMQYLLCESLILATLGAALASLVIFNIPSLLQLATDEPLPTIILQGLRVDVATIATCLVLCLGASLVFGWLPATRFSRPVLLSSLKDDAGGGGFRVGRIHRVTAALQVAIAVPLLVMGGICLDRMRSTATADLGFAADLLYSAPVRLDTNDKADADARLRGVSATLAGADGVAAVTIADGLPLDFKYRITPVALKPEPNAAPRFVPAHVTRVGEDYVDTMGIPLLRGRALTAADRAGAEKVAVIAKPLADKLFPNADPGEAIGKQLTVGNDEKTQQALTIVGVVGDFPTSQMSTEREQLLVPLAQQPSANVFLIVRSRPGEPANKLSAALENAIRDLGPDASQAVGTSDGVRYAKITTGAWLRKNSMNDFLSQSIASGIVGGVILLLAALGIYGVVGLTVATRTREIAVRGALGATRQRLLVMILFDVVKLTTPGVVVGMLLTVGLLRLNSENMGIPLSEVEAIAYPIGAAIAVLVAVLASLGPARRASSIQPMVAMRTL